MRRGRSVFSLLLPILILSLFTPFTCAAETGQEEQRSPDKVALSSKFLSIDGIKIHFVEVGEGRPLLFLHGLGGSWEDWAANLKSFAPAHRAMAIDFPGFGDSDKPEREYSIEWFTEVVEKFLAERKLDRVTVVGHSMGALVALNLAFQSRSRVEKLIVADVVGLGDKTEFLSYILTKKIIGFGSRWEPMEGVMRRQFKGMIGILGKIHGDKTTREIFQSAPKSPVTGHSVVPMTPSVQMCASIIDFDIRPKLASILQPTLILWGEKDPIAPIRDAEYIKGKIPRSTLKILEGCGHAPMQEKPALFDREVGKFLQAEE